MNEADISKIYLFGGSEKISSEEILEAIKARYPIGTEWTKEALEVAFSLPENNAIKIIDAWAETKLISIREDNGVKYYRFLSAEEMLANTQASETELTDAQVAVLKFLKEHKGIKYTAVEIAQSLGRNHSA